MYDVIIIGGGPAGMSAAIYAGRGGKKTAVIEGEVYGGQIALTHELENYPGIKKINGFDLGMILAEQAQSFGAEIIADRVVEIEAAGDIKRVKCAATGTIEGRTLILCMGAAARMLGAEGEKENVGRGVSYCATCDGNFYKGKEVVVVGGGNTALEEAVYLSGIAAKVTLIHRRKGFRADAASLKRAQTAGVNFLLERTVKRIEKAEKGLTLTLDDGRIINTDGLFVAIGRNPDTAVLQGSGIELDEAGYIITDRDMRTSVGGVYAAGDVTAKKLRQAVTAAADGAIAGSMAVEYLEK